MSASAFTVYSKVPCPYCEAAKRLLSARNIPYTLIDLTDKDDEIMAMKNQWGHATVPIVIYKDKLIGGYDELAALDRSGQLKQMATA